MEQKQPRPPLQVLRPHTELINGITYTMGDCPCCGRQLRRSQVRMIGARCYYEGTQFDRSGRELFSLLMEPQTIRALRELARRTYQLYPTQAVAVVAS